MKQDFIASHLRRTNRNLTILTILELAAAIYLLSFGGITALVQMLREISKDASLMGVISSFFENFGPVLLFIAGLTVLRHAIANIIRLTMRKFNGARHPIHKAVSLYGYFDQVAQYIHDDFMKPGTKRYNHVYITDHWILQRTALELKVLKIEDVVWAYQAVTRHKQGFVGPGLAVGPSEAGRTYGIVIHSRNPLIPELRISAAYQLNLSEEVALNTQEAVQKSDYVLSILEELEQKHPSAIYGYSRDLAEMWNSDRASFIKSAGFGA